MDIDKDYAIEILAHRIKRELTDTSYNQNVTSAFLIDVDELTNRILNKNGK